MAAELIVKDSAKRDLAKSCAWHDDKRVGLGDRFLSHVQKCFDRITLHPFLHAEIDGVRQATLKKFSFVV